MLIIVIQYKVRQLQNHLSVFHLKTNALGLHVSFCAFLRDKTFAIYLEEMESEVVIPISCQSSRGGKSAHDQINLKWL